MNRSEITPDREPFCENNFPNTPIASHRLGRQRDIRVANNFYSNFNEYRENHSICFVTSYSIIDNRKLCTKCFHEHFLDEPEERLYISEHKYFVMQQLTTQLHENYKCAICEQPTYLIFEKNSCLLCIGRDNNF